jgi:hypothetical protein
MDQDNIESAEVPRLLRQARGAYSRYIRNALHIADCDDLPRNGPYVLGHLYYEQPSSDIFHSLGLSDEAQQRLLAKLLERGFVEPGLGLAVNDIPDLQLTKRGEAAAIAVGEAMNDVNHRLAHRLSDQEFEGFLAGFNALVAIKDELDEHHHH